MTNFQLFRNQEIFSGHIRLEVPTVINRLPIIRGLGGKALSLEIGSMYPPHDEIELLKERASIDEMTGLFRRQIFEEDLEKLISEAARRDDLGIALVVADVDGLKRINDNFGGFSEGDRLIVATARGMKQQARKMDRAYRIGGDESAVLMSVKKPETTFEEKGLINNLVNRFSLSIEEEIGQEDFPAEAHVGASVVAIIVEKDDTSATLMKKASEQIKTEKHLKRQKLAGQHGIEFHQDDPRLMRED